MNQKQRTNIFDDVKLAHKKYLSCREERDNINKKIEEEIKEAEKKIRESYQSQIDQVNKDIITSDGEYEDCKKLLKKYSTFDYKMIGSVIAELMSIVEGEEYSYQEAVHETYCREATVFGSESFPVKTRVLMSVKSNYKETHFHDYDDENNEVNRLVRDGHALVLAEEKHFSKNTINFNGIFATHVDYDKFPYVKEFINSVVQYRYEFNLDEISKKDLLSLMNKFILSKKELIKENYAKRMLERQEQLRQEMIKEQLRYEAKMQQMGLDAILENGVASRHSNSLYDRLQEDEKENVKFNNEMSQFEILYGGEKHTAKFTLGETMVSSPDIFISKIDIEASIKNYFDETEPDAHFRGECNINLVDDGLVGIVDISDLGQNLDEVINSSIPREQYKIDRISDKYLRILYLPNKGEYSHKHVNIYGWIMEGIVPNHDKNLDSKRASYKVEWDKTTEADKLQKYLKDIELIVSNFNEKQLRLYRQRKQREGK